MSEQVPELERREIARLEALAGGDAGAPVFPALAEARRRAGGAQVAERIAREGLRRRPEQVAGRVALGLALLDQGRVAEARQELERALDAVPDHVPAAAALERAVKREPVSQGEPVRHAASPASFELDEGDIERAFADAETDRDEVIDADRIARDAMRAAALDEPEGVARVRGRTAGLSSTPDADAAGSRERPRSEASADAGLPLATRTLADLLERQGHSEDARAIRSALAAREAGPSQEGSSGPTQAGRRDRRERVLRTLDRWLENLKR